MMEIDAIFQQEYPNKYPNKLTVKSSFCKIEREKEREKIIKFNIYKVIFYNRTRDLYSQLYLSY